MEVRKQALISPGASLMLDLKQQSKEIAQAIEEKPGEISIRRGKKK